VFVCILPEKAIPEMTYTVSGGTLNPTHSLTLSVCPSISLIVQLLSMSLSVYLSLCFCVSLCAYLSVCLVCLPISVRLSAYLSVFLRLSLCPFNLTKWIMSARNFNLASEVFENVSFQPQVLCFLNKIF